MKLRAWSRTWCWMIGVGFVVACGQEGDGAPRDASPPGDGAGVDAAAGRWSARASIGQGPRQEHAVAALDGLVYVLGGYHGDPPSVTDIVEAYDPATDQWTSKAPLPMAMHHVNAAVADGKIYVLGGLVGNGFTSAVGNTYAYDPGDDAWTEHSAMPVGTERGGGLAALLEGDIVVAGGLRGGAAVTDVQVFEVGTDTWTTGPSLPEPLDHLGGGVIDGTLYLAGGRDTSITSVRATLYEYLPGVSWQARAPLPTARGGVATAVHGGALYVFGGEGSDLPGGVFPDVERFTPGAGWESLAPMQTPRHGMGAARVGDVVHVPGGGNRQFFSPVAVHEAFAVP